MSDISNRIQAIYSRINENDPRHNIASKYVDEALDVLNKFRVHDTKGLFYYLSAISY